MNARTWQMAAAIVSVGLMVFVLFKYGLRDDQPPTTRTNSEPHAGAQHHSAETTHMGGQLAPLQPFANAKVGAWVAYRVLNRSTMLPSDIEAFVIARVTGATDQSVTVEYKGNAPALPEKRKQWEREYPRQGLTIDLLTSNDIGKWTIFDLEVTDDEYALGDRKLTCKKLTWSAKDPLFPNKRVREELWISDAIPVDGIVADRDVQDMDAFHGEQSRQLIGYGTADATTWGTKPAGM